MLVATRRKIVYAVAMGLALLFLLGPPTAATPAYADCSNADGSACQT